MKIGASFIDKFNGKVSESFACEYLGDLLGKEIAKNIKSGVFKFEKYTNAVDNKVEYRIVLKVEQ